MNSHAKFRGAERRRFSVIYEKPPGGADIRSPPSVRGLTGGLLLLVEIVYTYFIAVKKIQLQTVANQCCIMLCCANFKANKLLSLWNCIFQKAQGKPARRVTSEAQWPPSLHLYKILENIPV